MSLMKNTPILFFKDFDISNIWHTQDLKVYPVSKNLYF
jgi:hypothetical protein